jgi:hypothetical protein
MDNSAITPKEQPVLISSRILMGLIGILGLILPLVLVFISMVFDDCYEVQSSISAYYHTNSRDVFVGILCCLAFAFFAYRGYYEKYWFNDSFIGNVSAFLALGVAFFPTSVSYNEDTLCVPYIDTAVSSKIHYICAIFLFICLAIFAIFQFTKTKDGYVFFHGRWQQQAITKKYENLFYISCGVIIVFGIILAGVYISLPDDLKNNISDWNPIFILETIMVWAFSFAWLRKSKYLGMIDQD